MKRKILSIVMVLVLCMGLLPGMASADTSPRQIRTERLSLTRQAQQNEAEGWKWEADAENGIFTLTLDNVNFQVADNSAISLALSGGFLDTVSIILKGENHIVSTNTPDSAAYNIYQYCGIYSDAGGPKPHKIIFSGGGSLSVAGKLCGINLYADNFEVSNVTINAQSDKIDALNFWGDLTVNNSSITTNTLNTGHLTVKNSTITADIHDAPSQPGNATIIHAPKGCDISDSTLTLTGPAETPVYAALHSASQSETNWNISDSTLDVRNCQYGMHVQFGKIALNNVEGTLFCTNDNGSSIYQNAAFFSNEISAVDCGIYAQTKGNLFIYGNCAMPTELQETTVPYHLYIQDNGRFTVGADQKISFTSNSCYIYDTPTAQLVNNGTVEFTNGSPTIQTSFVNNGTLIAPAAPAGILCDHTNFTNNGNYDGFLKEEGGTTMYAYGVARHDLGADLGETNWGTYKRFVTPGATLIIPNGKTIYANKSENKVTWETLSEYLSVSETGQIVVEEGGALLLPEGTTQEQLNNLRLSGDGTVKVGDTEIISLTFQDGDAASRQYVALGSAAEKPADPTRSGYAFGGWYKEEACENAWDFEIDTVTENMTLYAKWTAKSSGGSGSSAGSTGQTSSAVTSTATTTTAAPAAGNRGGTASSAVSSAMGSEIVRQAVENNSESVVIAPEITGGVTGTEVSIPASTVGEIGSKTGAGLTVSTPVADVTIPNGALGSLSAAGGTVTVAATQKDGGVELTVTAGGRTVESIPGGVKLAVPVSDAAPGTVAVLVHGDGTRQVVRKSVAEGGSITVPLDGSAKLEIVDNSRQYSDVSAGSWAADAVAFASAHELFNGTGEGQFSPDLPMSRGMLAVVLYNLESNPGQALTGVFTDVSNGAWYAGGVAWAAENGIVNGYGGGLFGPNDSITREQLAVMLWRYAGSPAAANKELNFKDADSVSGYALEAMRWAVENGILNGYGNGLLGPQGLATRAQAAQMLKNYMSKQF